MTLLSLEYIFWYFRVGDKRKLIQASHESTQCFFAIILPTFILIKSLIHRLLFADFWHFFHLVPLHDWSTIRPRSCTLTLHQSGIGRWKLHAWKSIWQVKNKDIYIYTHIPFFNFFFYFFFYLIKHCFFKVERFSYRT